MKRDIPDYVSKCVVCQKTKLDRGKQPGLLQPLPLPASPWESISMDFIFGLPKSIHGNTGIWAIVDRFSKQAHFIPVKKTIKAHQMATLFISQIFKYHGLPSSIVSDRDPRMTSSFWKGLFENLGTRLNFSSAYHPQTDGQSEIANLTILDLLKSYVMEVDQRSQWEKYLPLVEYAYNNTVHTSTGKAPFEVIEGRSKSPLLLKVHGKILAADEYSCDLKESFQKIKEAISISQQKQKAAANKLRRALAFKENGLVLLKFPKVRLSHTSGKNPTGHQKYYAMLAKSCDWGQRPSIKVAQNGFVVVDSTRLWTNQDDTFVFPNQCDQVFYYPMHGDTNWKYVIDVAPRATRVLQSTQELSTIDDVNRILDDNDDDTSEEGGSFSDAKLEYSSTSTDGSASKPENSFLNAFELDTNTDEIDTFSHSSIGLNLEIVLEINHEDLYADITSVL
ncbi:hypothetical protein L7F22_026284 [Adiantum nelumboides]|nr:hypothetical protein [Adiantum nelumboides]